MKRKLALLLVLALLLGLLTVLSGCGNNTDLNAEKSPLSDDLDAAGDAYVGQELNPIEESELDEGRESGLAEESYEEYDESVK